MKKALDHIGGYRIEHRGLVDVKVINCITKIIILTIPLIETFREKG